KWYPGATSNEHNTSLTALVSADILHKVPDHWHQFSAPHPIWHPILGTLYCIIAVVSLIGNGLVLWVFSMTQSLRSGTNVLTMNLAASDLMMMFTNFPILISNCFNKKWILGPLACEFYGFCGALFGTVSIITMALIALDRYHAIVTPFAGRRLTCGRALLWVLGAWLYSILFCILPFFGWNQYVLEGFLTSCTFDYLSRDMWSRAYVILLFFVAYIFPLTVICCCYVKIVVSVNKHDEALLASSRSEGVRHTSRNFQRREAQLARVVFTSVFFWVLAWTPYAIMVLLGLFSFDNLLTPLTAMLPALFAKLFTVYNPFIYAVSHPKFRQEVAKKLPWLYCIMPPLPPMSQNSSIKSDTSSLHFLSRSASVVSSRIEKAKSDLPSPTTLMNTMSYNPGVRMYRDLTSGPVG
ncbi:unnamed protein product, partial [Meganyctiphanes norvegica]